jgi:hypothetical protein
MTPKEKAVELMSKFVMYTQTLYENDTSFAIECALIAVDEILKLESNNGYYFDGTNVTSISYWQEVKQEIEAL